MSSLDYTTFLKMFDELCKDDSLDIRYTETIAKGVVHRVKRIFKNNDQLFLKELEINDSRNTTTIKESEPITETSLKTKHAYLALLFVKLMPVSTKMTDAWEGFKHAKSKTKWLIRNFILDTQLVGGLVGRVIAYSANKANPYYTTYPSHILAKTLAPLIFPAGSKTPKLEKQGTIVIDSILYKHYKAFENYHAIYTSKIFPSKTIVFVPKVVQMLLNGSPVHLETVIASNECAVRCDKNHLHIVYFNGNSGCFQDDYQLIAEDLIEFSVKKTPVSAILFNYPGILKSEGRVEYSEELVDAGIAQVQKLLDEGVSPENIVLHGVSLGGSISSLTAIHFYDKGILLGGLYVSRTFASTAQVGRNFFNKALGDNILSRFISTLLLPMMKLGTWVSGWDLDTGDAFFKFPRNKRNYSVVISHKKNVKEYLQKQKRTTWQKLTDFLLIRNRGPTDDAILGRGLHDSWEKKWEACLTKCGWYGAEARRNYDKENQHRKMVVVDFDNYELAPHIDGHAIADYSYLLSDQTHRRINPKQNKVIGLVHHSLLLENSHKEDDIRQLLKEYKEKVMDHEAGSVFRNWVLKVTTKTPITT